MIVHRDLEGLHFNDYSYDYWIWYNVLLFSSDIMSICNIFLRSKAIISTKIYLLYVLI